jgi:drug/metabolite transporter (DMT)-like permease
MSPVERSPMAVGTALAVASAVAFGATTPIVARAGAGLGPLSTAALLYAGAAVMALVLHPFSARSGRAIVAGDARRLMLVALFGSALAPALFAWGVQRAGATATSLALNLEAVFTMLLAWVVHREPIGRRAGGAVVVMLLGGTALAFDHVSSLGLAGVGAVVAATGCWATDNTITRGLAENDPLDVVAGKGTLGAAMTGVLALVFHEPMPAVSSTAALLACGATGYGLSLRLYLLAQRRIGAGRTGSVFAVGPFVGAAISWAFGDRELGLATVLGGIAFGVGVYLHVTERHGHHHVHGAITHEHAHRHDDGHHDHVHAPPVVGEHSHVHTHVPVEHEHEHAPDVHHDHEHA